jgi:DNA-directed RNA polymerase sigma subunit (sigma70/sigma32)
VAELAEAVGMPEAKVARLLSVAAEPLSLSEATNAEGRPLEDVIADETAADPCAAAADAAVPAEINRLLAGLRDRDRNVLTWRFGLDGNDPLTREEIARHLRVSTERVRQIEVQALALLRTQEEIEASRDLLTV